MVERYQEYRCKRLSTDSTGPSIKILDLSQPFLSQVVFKVINFLDPSSSSSHFRCVEVAISAIACYLKNLKNAWCLRFVAQLNLEKSSKGQHYHKKPSSQWSLNFQEKMKVTIQLIMYCTVKNLSFFNKLFFVVE